MDQVKINATKTNLRKIIQWTRSRHNPHKKSEVISLIYEAIQEGKDLEKTFTTGTFSEASGGYGYRIKLIIKNDKNFLIIYIPLGKKKKILKKYQLIKGKRGQYPLKEKPNYIYSHEGKKSSSPIPMEEKKIQSYKMGDFRYFNIRRINLEGDNFVYVGIKEFIGKIPSLVDPALVESEYYQPSIFRIPAKNLEDLKEKLTKKTNS